ncbi:Trypanosomal VSG domain [Trypanosoma vivax]|nr:Trypanosomal VSG domain [Trypanosoma vivax]
MLGLALVFALVCMLRPCEATAGETGHGFDALCRVFLSVRGAISAAQDTQKTQQAGVTRDLEELRDAALLGSRGRAMTGDQDGACTPTSTGAVRTVSDILCAAKAQLEQAGKDIEGAEGEAAKAVFGANAEWSDMSDDTRQQALLKDLISPAGSNANVGFSADKKSGQALASDMLWLCNAADGSGGSNKCGQSGNGANCGCVSAAINKLATETTWTVMRDSAGLDVNGNGGQTAHDNWKIARELCSLSQGLGKKREPNRASVADVQNDLALFNRTLHPIHNAAAGMQRCLAKKGLAAECDGTGASSQANCVCYDKSGEDMRQPPWMAHIGKMMHLLTNASTQQKKAERLAHALLAATLKTPPTRAGNSANNDNRTLDTNENTPNMDEEPKATNHDACTPQSPTWDGQTGTCTAHTKKQKHTAAPATETQKLAPSAAKAHAHAHTHTHTDTLARTASLFAAARMALN